MEYEDIIDALSELTLAELFCLYMAVKDRYEKQSTFEANRNKTEDILDSHTEQDTI